MNALPEGWEQARVGDVCVVKGGKTPSKFEARLAASERDDRTIPFYKVGDMANDPRYLVSARVEFADDEVDSFGITLAEPGSVVFPKAGGAIATNKKRSVRVQGGIDLNCMAVKAGPNVDDDYLYWWFQQIDLASLSDGSILPQLSKTTIEGLRLPLPPLGEQRRIVGVLEDHLSRLDVATASLRKVLAQLDAFRLAVRASAMAGVVGARDFGAGGWPRMSLDQLQAPEPASITDGPFGSNLKSAHYTTGGARVIRLQNVGLGDFREDEAYISLEHFEGLRRHEAVAGDLIVASLGDLLPRVCILPDLGGPAIVKADCIRVRLGAHVRPEWVLMSMLTPQARSWAKAQLHGVGRMRLGLKAIRGFTLPVPDLQTQDAILDAVKEQVVSAASVEASALATLRLRDAMQRSLFTAAFAGHLTKESVSV